MSTSVPSFASLLLSLDVHVDENNAHHQTITNINANKVSITAIAETLGWEHPDTLNQLNALVDLYLKAHCSEYAERLCHRLRLAFKRTYAPDNFIHANVSINMGIALNQQMKYK
ncbi:hypothetical protein EON65_47900 [archaeon]|nr:MAG: hypothetical protein EON65_47900 [archaeon]